MPLQVALFTEMENRLPFNTSMEDGVSEFNTYIQVFSLSLYSSFSISEGRVI